MKKILGIALIAVFGAALFFACEKEESSNKSYDNQGKMFSYDGTTFHYDTKFINPFENIGQKHNQLFSILADNWKNFNNMEYFNKDFLDFTVLNTYELFPNNDIESLMSTEDFSNLIIQQNNSCDGDLSYVEEMEKFFSQFPNDFYHEFINDVEKFAYGDLSYEEQLALVSVIEQKVYHTKISSEVKDYYLIFCSVAKYSLINIEKIAHDPSSPFYQLINNRLQGKGKLSGNGDIIFADACGAVKGAQMGAEAGMAAGPEGAVILGAVGAVGVGALSSAVEGGINRKIIKWLDRIF